MSFRQPAFLDAQVEPPPEIAALNLPLLEHPEMLEEPVSACRSAGWFWDRAGLNAWADVGDFQRITKRINGGLNGYEDRLAYFERAKEVLSV